MTGNFPSRQSFFIENCFLLLAKVEERPFVLCFGTLRHFREKTFI